MLVDEEERPLKSFKNYKDAWEHILELSPPLKSYLIDNLVISTGDWPTWYFQKKIIAKVKNNKY